MKKLKIILGILLALTLFGFRAPAAHAKAIDLWPFNDLWDNISCVTDINCTVRAAATGALNYTSFAVVGEELYNEVSRSDIEEMKAGKWNKGLAAVVGKIGATAYISPPPGRLADFIKEELSDNILNSRVEALTPGTVSLNPVSNIWRAMRNLAYGLFLLVMLVIGFMIMLQHQLPARTVVTVTYALPRVLVGLVLITFSFPIIAFVVDAVAVFGVSIIWGLIGGLVSTIEAPAATQVGGAAGAIAGFLTVVNGFTLDAGASLGGALANLIVINGIMLGSIILFVMAIYRLFASYVWILLHTVFSPIIFLAGSLPGQEETITKFGKQLLSKTLVFPVMLFMFVLALYFAGRTLLPATTSIFTGEGFGETLGNVVFFKSFLGPLLTLFMLGAAYKAPSFVDEALGLNKPTRGKK